ncbi:hypothetical protein M086_1876 [Bacteroides fragilis str. S13 L11]|nr:hypothetical protein M086_1876 [Bacteroides fragilis str. S13 L11]
MCCTSLVGAVSTQEKNVVNNNIQKSGISKRGFISFRYN